MLEFCRHNFLRKISLSAWEKKFLKRHKKDLKKWFIKYDTETERALTFYENNMLTNLERLLWVIDPKFIEEYFD